MQKNGRIMIGILTSFILLLAPMAGAESPGVFNLGEVVVTEKADTIAGVATVETVTTEKIDLENARNINAALETLPGVYTNVGRKNESNINIRGFNERYVPVFYDGIPLYLPYDGYVDTGNLPSSNVSKVTLSKGISSVLYGANGMGGVINIVSKKPQKRFEGDIAAEFIEDSSFYTHANVGTRQDKFYLMVNASLTDSDGYLLSDDYDATDTEDGDRRENSDISDVSMAAKIGFIPAKGHEYAIGFQRVDREKGLPPNAVDDRPRYWRFTDWEKQTYYLIGDTRISDTISLKTRIYRDEYYNVLDSYDNDTYASQTRRYAFHSTYDDYSTGGSLLLRTEFIPRNTLSFSFHYKEDVHEAQGDYGDVWERYEQKTFSYAVEDDFKINDRLALVAGVGFDVNAPEYANGGEIRDDETAVSPQIGMISSLNDDCKLHFSVGAKTRFATMFELYSEQFGRNIANPDLEEEKAVNWEAGVDYQLGGDSDVGVTLFYSDVDDLIVEREVAPRTDQYQNIGEARFMGAELSFHTAAIKNHDITLHYTYLEAENRSEGRTSDHLEDQSKHKLYISDEILITDWLSLYGKVSYNSKRYYEDFDSDGWETLDGYWIADLKAMFHVIDAVTLEAGVKNLFDEDYEQSPGYPREGRVFFAGVRARF